jgi:hypothetical protein
MLEVGKELPGGDRSNLRWIIGMRPKAQSDLWSSCDPCPARHSPQAGTPKQASALLPARMLNTLSPVLGGPLDLGHLNTKSLGRVSVGTPGLGGGRHPASALWPGGRRGILPLAPVEHRAPAVRGSAGAGWPPRCRADHGAGRPDLGELIPRYSTNQDFSVDDDYDWRAGLQRRGLLTPIGFRETAWELFHQSFDDFIDGQHSMGGLSRERMGSHSVAEFDRELRAILVQTYPAGHVQMEVCAVVGWARAGAGRPV